MSQVNLSYIMRVFLFEIFFLLLGEDVFTSAVDMIRSSNVHGPPAPITDTVSLHDVVGLQEGMPLFLQLNAKNYINVCLYNFIFY